jgi:glycosyltransferase involved in cell wall biosynthesis
MILKIGMILQNRFPPDIRVQKESKALIAAGFKVFLLCKKEKEKNKFEKLNGLFINRIDFKKQRSILKRFNSLWFYLTLYHPFWAKEIEEFISRNKIDVLHVHDLPLLGTALKVGAKKKIPVVSDLHENYPEALKLYKHRNKNLKTIFYNEKRLKSCEKKWLKKAKKIIVVVEEGKARIMDYGISEKKIIVVSNLEEVEAFNKIRVHEEIVKKYRDNFVISYIGGFGTHRGIDSAIKALPHLKEKIPELKLLLVGGKDYLYEKEFKKIAKNLKVTEYTEFIGWQPFEKVPSYIEASDICLVPYKKSIQTDASSPHKLFQHMLKGKPILVSNCKSLTRIIKETNSGLIFRAGDARDLAEKVLKIYRDNDLRKKLGVNGQRAALESYNWEKESKKLINLYRGLKEKNDF